MTEPIADASGYDIKHKSDKPDDTIPIDMNNDNDERETTEDSRPWYQKLTWKSYIKIFIVIAILVFLILAVVFSSTTGDIATDFLKWMQDNPAAGAFAFIALYFFATVLMIPGLILTVGAGFVFAQVLSQIAGVFVATLVVFVGASAGASVAMLVGRFVLRDSVATWAHKYEKFGLIDKLVGVNGLKVTFLLRLAPIIPFNAFNYFMGLTSVRFRDYCLAHVGMLPGTLAYSFLGSTLSAVTDASSAGFTSNTTVFVVFIVGCVLAFVGMIYIGYVAKKEFTKLAAEAQRRERESMEQQQQSRPNPDHNNDGNGNDGNNDGDNDGKKIKNNLTPDMDDLPSQPLTDPDAPPKYSNPESPQIEMKT